MPDRQQQHQVQSESSPAGVVAVGTPFQSASRHRRDPQPLTCLTQDTDVNPPAAPAPFVQLEREQNLDASFSGNFIEPQQESNGGDRDNLMEGRLYTESHPEPPARRPRAKCLALICLFLVICLSLVGFGIGGWQYTQSHSNTSSTFLVDLFPGVAMLLGSSSVEGLNASFEVNISANTDRDVTVFTGSCDNFLTKSTKLTPKHYSGDYKEGTEVPVNYNSAEYQLPLLDGSEVLYNLSLSSTEGNSTVDCAATLVISGQKTQSYLNGTRIGTVKEISTSCIPAGPFGKPHHFMVKINITEDGMYTGKLLIRSSIHFDCNISGAMITYDETGFTKVGLLDESSPSIKISVHSTNTCVYAESLKKQYDHNVIPNVVIFTSTTMKRNSIMYILIFTALAVSFILASILLFSACAVLIYFKKRNTT